MYNTLAAPLSVVLVDYSKVTRIYIYAHTYIYVCVVHVRVRECVIGQSRVYMLSVLGHHPQSSFSLAVSPDSSTAANKTHFLLDWEGQDPAEKADTTPDLFHLLFT